MWNSWFGAGEGPTAFAYDMMVLEDIEKERQSYGARRSTVPTCRTNTSKSNTC